MKKMFLVICLFFTSSLFPSMMAARVVAVCYVGSIPLCGIAGATYDINECLDSALKTDSKPLAIDIIAAGLKGGANGAFTAAFSPIIIPSYLIYRYKKNSKN